MKIMRNNFVVEGLLPLESIPDESFGQVIYHSLSGRKNGEPVLTDGYSGQSITYSELLVKTCSLAKAIRSSGYGSDTTIAICSNNNLQYFIPVIASLYIGATVVTINDTYTFNELVHVTSLSQPKLIFCSGDLLSKFFEMREQLAFIGKIVILDSEENSTKAECMSDFIQRNITAPIHRFMTTAVNVKEHTAFILCSSGTTGLPKGVMLTHRNINAIVTHFRDPRIHVQNAITFCAVPFFHAYGLFVVLANMVMHCRTIFAPSFKPELFLRSIQTYRVTRLFLVPSIIVVLTKRLGGFNYDLSSVKEVFCSAAPLNKRTEEEFKKMMTSAIIRQGYGLTEVTHCMMFNGVENSIPKQGSTGKVLTFVKVAVKDLETGRNLGPKEKGEICVKGEIVMKGYLDNPEANEMTFTKDGWFRTGDVGYYDEDEYFFITDRIKDLIKYKGFQVAPAELEAVLLTHPEILDAAVIGVPDEVAGQLPLAFVVTSRTSKVSEKEIQDFAKGQLSPQKWLRGGVIMVEAIAKNQSGKILKKNLRQIFNNKMSKL